MEYSKMSGLYAVPLVALSTLLMAYSSLMSMVPILIFYALWLPQILLARPFVLRLSGALILPGLLAAYCILSLIWSAYPLRTLILGLEYASMIVCVVIIARRVAAPDFVKGVALGTFLVLAVLFSGGEFSFEGWFGSKNQVGFFAQTAIIMALLLLFTLKKKPLQQLVFVLVPLALGAHCLVLSESAASVVALLAVLAVFALAVTLNIFKAALRPLILGLMILTVATLAVALSAFDINVKDRGLAALDKSPTLTGRTYLWEEGVGAGLVNPVFGHGYGAFWVHGQPHAERLWQEFHIAERTGFHFHNLFIQSFVDLGLIGALLMGILVAGACGLSLLHVMRRGVRLETMLPLGISFMFLVRTMVEVDFLGPFGMGPLLFYVAWIYATAPAPGPLSRRAPGRSSAGLYPQGAGASG